MSQQSLLTPRPEHNRPTHSNVNSSFMNISKSIISVKEQVSKGFSAKYYPFLALVSGLCFSLHNIFFIEAITSGAEQGHFASILFPYFVGEGLFAILVMMYRGMQSYVLTGHIWTKKHSNYFYEIPNSGTRDHLA